MSLINTKHLLYAGIEIELKPGKTTRDIDSFETKFIKALNKLYTTYYFQHERCKQMNSIVKKMELTLKSLNSNRKKFAKKLNTLIDCIDIPCIADPENYYTRDMQLEDCLISQILLQKKFEVAYIRNYREIEGEHILLLSGLEKLKKDIEKFISKGWVEKFTQNKESAFIDDYGSIVANNLEKYFSEYYTAYTENFIVLWETHSNKHRSFIKLGNEFYDSMIKKLEDSGNNYLCDPVKLLKNISILNEGGE